MKKIFCILGMAVLCLLMGACGEKAAQWNVEETAAALVSEGSFEDKMSEASADIFEMLYYGVDMSTVEELSFYMSTGATAEEVTVVRCSSEEAARKLETIARERVQYLKDSFENYVPKELTKLENPVLKQEGVYLILCISADDNKAAQIVESRSGR